MMRGSVLSSSRRGYILYDYMARAAGSDRNSTTQCLQAGAVRPDLPHTNANGSGHIPVQVITPSSIVDVCPDLP